MSIRHWFESHCTLSGGSVGILETIQTKPWHYNNKCIDAQTRLIGKMPITFYFLAIIRHHRVFCAVECLVVLVGNKYELKNNICTWIFILSFLILLFQCKFYCRKKYLSKYFSASLRESTSTWTPHKLHLLFLKQSIRIMK